MRLGATRHLARRGRPWVDRESQPARALWAYAHTNEQVRLGARGLARSFPEISCTVVESTLWSDIGMAADQTTPARLAGFAHIPPTWGVDMLTRILAEQRAPSSVAVGGPVGLEGFAVRALPGVAGTADPTLGGRRVSSDSSASAPRWGRPYPSAGRLPIRSSSTPATRALTCTCGATIDGVLLGCPIT